MRLSNIVAAVITDSQGKRYAVLIDNVFQRWFVSYSMALPVKAFFPSETPLSPTGQHEYPPVKPVLNPSCLSNAQGGEGSLGK